MKAKVFVVCGIVAMLGIISAIAGFAAEATKPKPSQVHIEGDTCVYPRTPTLALGILSAVFVGINRIYMLSLFGFCGLHPEYSSPTATSWLFNNLSWIASIIAVCFLVAGARRNTQEGGEVFDGRVLTCYLTDPWVLEVGAALSLLSAFFGIVAYVSISLAAVPANVDLEKNSGY